MAKEITSKTTSTKTTGKGFAADKTGGYPRKPATKASKAELKVEAAKPSKKPATARSGAAKRAEPVPAKKVATRAVKPSTVDSSVASQMSKLAKAATKRTVVAPAGGVSAVPHTSVGNVGQLIAALGKFQSSAKFATDRKHGVETVTVLNLRGRPIATIGRDTNKPAPKKAAAKK